jgi:Sec-independent protein secretion pathway component TatC
MLLMMFPILFLYEGSILLASVLDRRAARAYAREESDAADPEPSDLEPDD